MTNLIQTIRENAQSQELITSVQDYLIPHKPNNKQK